MSRPVRSRPRPFRPVPEQPDLFLDAPPAPASAFEPDLGAVVVDDRPVDATPADVATVKARPEAVQDSGPPPDRKSPPVQNTSAPAVRAMVATLADVLGVIEASPNPSRTHAEMRSAIKMTAKVLDRPLRDIPADPPALAKLLASANPALATMTMDRWGRVRSLILAALGEAGVEAMPGRDVAGLSPAWREFSDKLSSKRMRYGLSRMMSYFSRNGIQPGDIDAGALAGFRVALITTSLDPTPETSFNTMARLWNEAAGSVPGWPPHLIEVTADPRRYSMAWEAFSMSFQADVEAFLVHGGNQDPFADDYAPSVKPRTVQSRRKCIRQLATALVASGFRPDDLTSLAVLVDPANAKAALGHLMNRNDSQITPQMGNLAQLLCTISRHWVKAPADHDAILRKFASGLRIKQVGMKPKNRARLRQFDLPENLQALLTLPARILEEVRRHDTGGKGEAVRVMMGLAVEFLIMGAMRIDNLTGLEVDRHLVTIRRGGKASRHIVIPETETKTGAPFETAALLAAYLDKYRSRICPHPGPYLFPGQGGARRSTDSFSQLLKKFIKRETGLTMNPHLFRHLVGKLQLEAHPQDIETVRRVLGHTTTRTTLRAYANLQDDAAHRRYDQTIAGLRDGRAAASKRSPPSRPKAPK